MADCTDISGNPITTDQRGGPRPIDGNGDGVQLCDVGSYEASQAFDLCVQDDSSGNLLQINSTTGEYLFTNCSGFTVSGTGVVVKKGSSITLQHNAGDRRVTAKIDLGINKAMASIQILSPWTLFTIADRNTANDACSCR